MESFRTRDIVRKDLPSQDIFEDRSIIRSTLNTILSPAILLLDILDTPGGIVRDILAGDSPSEIFRGIIKPDERATGREVLDNVFGPTAESDKFTIGGFDVPSFLTAVATDPLMLFVGSVTGLTKTGQQARRVSKLFADKDALSAISKVHEAAGTTETLAYKKVKQFLDSTNEALETISPKTLALSPKNQIASSQRGLSFSIPFVKGEFVPTEFNKMLSPILQVPAIIGDKIADKFKGGVIEKLFRSSPKSSFGDVAQMLSKATIESKMADVAIKQEALEETFKNIVLEGGGEFSSTDLKKGVIKAVESADTLTNAPKYSNRKFEEIMEETVTKSLELENKKLGELSSASKHDTSLILEIQKKYDTLTKRLLTNQKKKVLNLQKETDSAIARAHKDLEFINTYGDLTQGLEKEFIAANESAINFEKSLKYGISHLSDELISYAKHSLTNFGKKLFNISERFKEDFRQVLSSRIGSSKERTARGMTIFELEDKHSKQFLEQLVGVPEKDLLKMGFSKDEAAQIIKGELPQIWNFDPITLRFQREIESTRAINTAANATAAVNLLASKEGSVHIAEIFKHANLTGWLTPTGEEINWGLNKSVKQIKKALSKAGKTFKKDFNLYVPQEVFDDLLKIKEFKLGDAEGLLKILDSTNAVWRSWLLAVPAYIGTNFAGMSFANFLAKVTNPQYYLDAGKELISHINKVIPENTFTKKFKDLSPTTNRKFAKEYFDNGFSSTDYYRDLEKEIAQIDSPIVSKLTDNPLTKTFKGVNRFLDEHARLAHYISKRNDGLSILEAKRSVDKYLFDYSELTQFEKKVMKRLVLFYTFARKNLPFTLREIMSNRLALGLGKMSSDSLRQEEIVPEFVKEVGSLRVGKGTFLDPRNPLFEINKFSPQGGGPERVLDRILQLTVPGIKVPAELILQRETFRGKPLADVSRVSPLYKDLPFVTEVQTKTGPEYRGNPILLTLMRNLFFTRQGQILEDALNERIEFLPSLIGFRTRKFDPALIKLQGIRTELEQQARESPHIREFKKHFSINIDPDAKTKELLRLLEQTNKDLDLLFNKRNQ